MMISSKTIPMLEPAITIRAAQKQDGAGVAAILSEAFPALYRATLGGLEADAIRSILTDLYRNGFLTLEHTRVAVQEGQEDQDTEQTANQIIGVCILHLGESIGRGSPLAFWRLLRKHLNLWQAGRAFVGALGTNFYLSWRIPRAPDLVYIEALAVAAAWRNHGIGQKLLADAETWTRAHGRSRLALHVLARNLGARRLYERVGFVLWQEPRRPRHSAGWTALRMVRPLPVLPAPRPATSDFSSGSASPNFPEETSP